MKQLFTLFILAISLTAFATQETVTIELGSNLEQMAFYNVNEGANTASATAWDIRVVTKQRSAALRTNNAAGVQLYELVENDTSDWNTVDTTGMTPLFNRTNDWELGAFNLNTNSPGADFGWGVYVGPPSHDVFGEEIFVIKTLSGAFKKIWIVSHDINSVFVVRIADLDNSNESEFTIEKTPFFSRHFVYVNLADEATINYEPIKAENDITIGAVAIEDGNGSATVELGVLANPDVKIAIADENIQPDASAFTATPDLIGSNVDLNKFYFIDNGTDIYSIQFTTFDANSGTVVFNRDDLETNIFTPNIVPLAAYPNPTSTQIKLGQQFNQANFSILSYIGQTVLSGKTNGQIDVSNVAEGEYLLQVKSAATTYTTKISIAR